MSDYSKQQLDLELEINEDLIDFGRAIRWVNSLEE